MAAQANHHDHIFQLFALSELFRNQQVAGSIPAGGSIIFNDLAS